MLFSHSEYRRDPREMIADRCLIPLTLLKKFDHTCHQQR